MSLHSKKKKKKQNQNNITYFLNYETDAESEFFFISWFLTTDFPSSESKVESLRRMWAWVWVSFAAHRLSCSSLRWTSGYGGMTEEIKGCYWIRVHILILWYPCTHSCKVRAHAQLYSLFCGVFLHNIFSYNVQQVFIRFCSISVKSLGFCFFIHICFCHILVT